jgi:acyl-CoA thioesterase
MAERMTTLSQLLATAQPEPNGLSLSVPSDWMQGRSVFGGLQVAVALRAMRVLVPHAILRTLQTTFIAPVAGELRVQARILRTGKNAIAVEARIGDADSTQALVIGVFGAKRSSAVSEALVPRAIEPKGAVGFEAPLDADGAPHFARHFKVRWVHGKFPFAGDASVTEQVLEIGMQDDGPTTEAHVVAIADFIPPIALTRLSAPVPGSTLTWMLELLADRYDHLPLSGWRVEAELVAARDGYTSQSVAVFGPAGEPIALSHQSMLVFG